MTATPSPGAALRRAADTRAASVSNADRAPSSARFQRGNVGRGVEGPQFVLPVPPERRQFGRRAPIAARERHPGREPVVDGGQAVRLEVGAVEVAVEGVRRVLELGLRALQHLDRRGELRVVGGHRLQRIDRARRQALGVAVGVGHRFERLARGLEQGLGIGELAMLGIEFGPFVVAGGELVDLGDLPRQALALAFEVGLPRLVAVSRACAADRQAAHAAPSAAVSMPA